MLLTPYRRVLSRPGVPALLLVVLLARVPITAAPVVLTLHVVLDLHRGFAAAGLVGAAGAVGAAVGAPLMGRGIDRLGLRAVLGVTTVVDGAFWVVAPQLAYPVLLVTAVAAGLLAIPVFSLSRQALSAMVPPSERQAGFSLDSMGVELSFAMGPAAGIWLLTATDARTTLLTIGALVVAGGAALFVLDPPVRADDERLPPAARTAPSPAAGTGTGGTGTAGAGTAGAGTAGAGGARWLTTPVVAVLLVTFAATVTVAGTDTALTAVLRSLGRLDRLGLVFAIWCLASLVGGFVVGASRWRASPVLVLALLAVLCLPVALAGSWPLLALLVVPTGLFCAPLMSVTAQVLTGITPSGVRGLVLGVHSSALTVGNAVGAPLVGFVVDRADPRLGFVAVGVGGLVLAGAALLVQHSGARTGHGPLTASGQLAAVTDSADGLAPAVPR